MKKQYLSATCVVFELSCADILTLSTKEDNSIQKVKSIDFDDLFKST